RERAMSTRSLLSRTSTPPQLPSPPTRRSSDLARLVPPPRDSTGTSKSRQIRRAAAPSSTVLGITTPMGTCRKLEASVEYAARLRSEEHTSELQSRFDLVCRLLLAKKKRRQCGQ